jgi:ABC-type multidrug transport system fused ATPase/permease subunit
MADKEPKRRLSASKVWFEVRQLIYAHRGRLAIGLALILINSAAGLVLPWAPKYLIDTVVGHERADLLPRLVLWLAGAVVVQAGSSFALSQLLSVAAQRAVSDMRLRVQAHIARLPIAFFDASRTGQLISRIMTDAEGLRNLVGTGLVQVFGGALTASGALIYLFHLNFRLTVVTLVVLSLFAVLMSFAFRYLRPLFRKRGEINAEVTGRLGESLGAVRVIKAYVAETREEAKFKSGVDRLFQNVASTISAFSATTALGTICVGVIGISMVWIGGHAMIEYHVSQGQRGMSSGAFTSYLAFTLLVSTTVVQIAAIATQISEAFAGLDRIREVLSLPTEEQEHGGLESLPSLRGDITFEHVSFSYNAGEPVLKDVSFEAPAGSTIALVGSSGSGKSTLVSLIMGFHRPSSGRILIDGVDLRSVALSAMRSQLGVVFQDNVLFDGTVSENISFSRPQATQEEVRSAARGALCEEFIEGFEKKWETIVGERGVKLSGGQRQRIAIARAILANPRILVLDEATSSLDSESEALVQQGLTRLRAGRTTFVIAHRLSTIRAADVILVLEHGVVVERGRHEELYQADGRYRQLHDRQHRLQEDRYLNPGEEPRQPVSPVGAAAPRA